GEDAAEALDLAAERADAPGEAALLVGVDGKDVEALGEELRVEADGGEGVLDLVGEAAGHGADLGHAFGGAGAAFGGAVAGELTLREGARDQGGEEDASGEADEQGGGGKIEHSAAECTAAPRGSGRGRPVQR